MNRDPAPGGPLILVVEDDSANRALITALLQREGYRILAAVDGESGLRLALEEEPDAILLDVGLPRLDGHEVTRRLRLVPATRTVPIILLTGRASMDDMVQGLDSGADDFIAKPFKRPELLARLRSAVRMRQAILGMENARAAVAALANAVEAKDVTTEHHCERLVLLAARVGESVGLTKGELEALAYGALLHDVGKIGVPEAILLKPGPLDTDEWTILRRHPEIGERICSPLGLSREFLPIIRSHHERWDGGGYPDGLVGTQIPIGARIVGIVDAFDAMTHDRPYRPAMTTARALDELQRGQRSHFDPELVALFMREAGTTPTAMEGWSTFELNGEPASSVRDTSKLTGKTRT
ncbi:MAG: response regulator [Chloroflexi bacterium]|nr:response regulator [Chloroflexota bacterium]